MISRVSDLSADITLRTLERDQWRSEAQKFNRKFDQKLTCQIEEMVNANCRNTNTAVGLSYPNAEHSEATRTGTDVSHANVEIKDEDIAEWISGASLDS